MVSLRQVRPSHIAFGLHKKVCRCQTWSACTERSANVRRGKPASPLPCTQWSVGIKRGSTTSSVACWYRCIDIECGLRTSSIACTHWSIDVGCGLPALSAAYKYRYIYVGQLHTTSSKTCTHERRMPIYRKNRRPMAWRINVPCMHKSVK